MALTAHTGSRVSPTRNVTSKEDEAKDRMRGGETSVTSVIAQRSASESGTCVSLAH